MSSILRTLALRQKTRLNGICSKWKQIVRYLNVHEHVAYSLLKEAGIPVPPFGVAKTVEEVGKLAAEFQSNNLVLKAQVLTGGRGKGHFKGTNIGGVVMCETPDEAMRIAENMIGNLLITKQTGAAGRICNSVMVTTRMFPRKEYYLSIMMERTFGGPVFIASKEGGVEIEEVAATNPGALSYIPVDIVKGLSLNLANTVVDKLGFPEEYRCVALDIVCNLYKLFIEKDALLVEINPLAEDICGEYFALDCKCNFDDSAEYRQKQLFALRDWSQEDPNEANAIKYDLNYVQLDGIIGCMVNGAGLAMATMDLIKHYGSEPANFLDVGGMATVETITEAFKIITSDSRVLTVFVNIFGGIMRCDMIAEAIIRATKGAKSTIPTVVRLQGTNMNKARKMVLESKLEIILVDDFSKAGEAATKMAIIMDIANSINVDISIKQKVEKKPSRGPC